MELQAKRTEKCGVSEEAVEVVSSSLPVEQTIFSLILIGDDDDDDKLSQSN